MSFLSREQILQAPDITSETITVPEWGGDVIVRGMSGVERDELERVCQKKGKEFDGVTGVMALIVSLSIVDESGKRLFTADDITALNAKSSRAIGRVFEVAKRLSGLSSDDVDELAKNSEAAPNADSGSN